ncbi:hypothetical protein [Haloarcula argentinensis]|uniref:Uncharacterized protein n=1 Tax=Haloarcula argentinensis TaxID=43776 RepID=A0ABU2F2D7_HALAR|nr:hypothetical protein [Haloarcula argentinensis]MDS0254698.1 hypothetical protein [Haloarcula argentinensis]
MELPQFSPLVAGCWVVARLPAALGSSHEQTPPFSFARVADGDGVNPAQ